MKSKFLIGASLSESHTIDKDGMSIVFTKYICMEIQINGKSVMHSQKFTLKNWVKTRLLTHASRCMFM